MMSLRNYGATVPPILRIYIGRNLKLTERKENSRKAHLQALRHRNKKIGVTGFEPAASTSRTYEIYNHKIFYSIVHLRDNKKKSKICIIWYRKMRINS